MMMKVPHTIEVVKILIPVDTNLIMCRENPGRNDQACRMAMLSILQIAQGGMRRNIKKTLRRIENLKVEIQSLWVLPREIKKL